MSGTTVPNDPWGTVNKDEGERYPDSKSVADFHINADTDSSTKAFHHTLGTRRNQASQGDHVHDGENGKKIGDGLGLTVTGAKGGNAALTSLLAMLAEIIDFTDSTT